MTADRPSHLYYSFFAENILVIAVWGRHPSEILVPNNTFHSTFSHLLSLFHNTTTPPQLHPHIHHSSSSRPPPQTRQNTKALTTNCQLGSKHSRHPERLVYQHHPQTLSYSHTLMFSHFALHSHSFSLGHEATDATQHRPWVDTDTETAASRHRKETKQVKGACHALS